MAHQSRLRQAIARAALHCIICGCTEDKPCILEGGAPCGWASPGLCDNPRCIYEASAESWGVQPMDVDAEDEGLVA
jgi:hypothetical protein